MYMYFDPQSHVWYTTVHPECKKEKQLQKLHYYYTSLKALPLGLALLEIHARKEGQSGVDLH